MFNSTILDVAIGMIFIYLLLSVMCSSANELIELMLKKRAIDLERGIRELLVPNSDSGTDDIVQKLYDHSLVNNLFAGKYLESGIGSRLRPVIRTHLPSYIPARNFALALMDLVCTKDPTATTQSGDSADTSRPLPPEGGAVSGAAGATVGPPTALAPAQIVVNVSPSGADGADLAVTPLNQTPTQPALGDDKNPLTGLRNAILASPLIKDEPERALITLIDAAGNDVVKARENIENWYNSSMDRVSGWYKRRTQLTILVIGFFVAITVNVDTIIVAKRLSTDKALRESLVAAAGDYAKANAAAPATPSPSPTASPSATPTTEITSTQTPLASPVPTPAPEQQPTATPATTATDHTGSPDTLLPACVKDPASAECKAAMIACEDPDSPACLVAKTCSEPNSAECRQARALEIACKDPNSPKCKYLSNQQQLESLGLPIGWSDATDPKRTFTGWTWAGNRGGWWDQLKWHWLGWLLTAFAISLGAPFWFDLLNKFIVIRSAVKPHEKSPEEESKD